MRTTIRIEDDILDELKTLASQESAPFVAIVNQALRRGLSAIKSENGSSSVPFVQKTYDMGPPKFDVTKARWIAADLEDEEIMRKHARGE